MKGFIEEFKAFISKVKKGANKVLGRDENAGKEVEDEIVRK